ncbi:MAG TPA: TOMM precursor leader peptide-binding protein [Longimicrobiales bacterium]|nr:TOMM precursor leader peptide-binding protein [Longimicrobiales bacterium]
MTETETLALPSRPALRPSLVVGTVEPDQVFLLTETRQFALRGRPYRALASRLDGALTRDELLEAAGAEVGFPQALFALQELVRKGYVIEASGNGRPDSPSPGTLAWWDRLGAGPAEAETRVAAARVVIRAVGAADARPLRSALESVGIAAEPGDNPHGTDSLPPASATNGGPVHPLVVLADDYLRPELEAIDRVMRAAGRPWLLAKPMGESVWVGPVFVPGATGCWRCLSARLEENRQVERYVGRMTGAGGPVLTTRASAPGPDAYAAHLLAAAVERWVVTESPPEPLVGVIRTHDLVGWRAETHRVARRPQCPGCGDPALRDPSRTPPAVVLEPRAKRFTADGGHRTARPEETLHRLMDHVSPVTGVINRLERLTDDDAELAHSYSAGHNFAMVTDDLFFLRRNLRGQSGGKGMTDVQARVSAVCEAVERWAGVWRGDEPHWRAAARDVEDAVPLGTLLGFSEAQYADRHAWNEAQPGTRQHIVPEPLPPDHPVAWTSAWSLTSERRVAVPAAYVYFGHPDLRQLFFTASDANGCAAGNTLEEAILQGLLEVVERDATAVWWYNRLRRPALDLDSFRLPYVDGLREYYRGLGREFWVLDLTHDLGIPVFAGVSRRVDRLPEDVVIGLGAHLDPRVAMLRALTEMNQFLTAVAHTRPDGSTEYWFPGTDAHEWWRTATVDDEPWLAPDPSAPAVSATALPSLATDDLAEDVRVGVRRLAGAGLETLVVDQTRPDVDLRVAKVMVPGARHFWRRLGPGRLYDVPVDMGWRDAPLREEDLNPWSVFF